MGVFNALGVNTALNKYPADEQCQKEPTIEPGQVWLVECQAGSLSAFHSALLRRANVVLYERALVAAVAKVLPIGAYAEPLPAVGAAGPTVAPRALQFAADGWSVLQLIERRPGWRQLLRFATEEPIYRDAKSPLLAVGTIAASQYRQRSGTSADLKVLATELGRDELLSLTFAASAASSAPRRPAHGHAFTANGLAG